MLFWKLSYERTFCWSRHVRGCLAENRLMVVFWKLSGERACDVLLGQTLKRTCDVWKGCKHNPTDSGQCFQHWFVLQLFTGLCWSLLMLVFTDNTRVDSLLIFAYHDFIETNAPKAFWWYSSCFLLLLWICANRQSLVISSGLNSCYWLMFGVLLVNWTANNKDWNRPKELFLNGSKSPASY